MKIIDAHNHPDWHGCNLEKFLENMDACGIEKTWLLSWECGSQDYAPNYSCVTPAGVLGSSTGPIPFSRCLSYVERCPERFILGCCPDPRRPDACAALLAAHKIYGAKICGEMKVRTTFDNPDVIRFCRLAGELRMPVTLHLDYDTRKTFQDPWCEWYGGSIEALERLVAACPETVFLGHAPGFWIHISGDPFVKNSPNVKPDGRIPILLRKYPNLYCDISANSGYRALSRDPEFTMQFLAEFQDRVLYARDYFDNRHQEFLNSLGLPLEILEKIYFRNAEKLLTF